MKNNYFIIHGSFATPNSNWIPYLREEIEKEGLEVYTPDFPSGVGYQNYENWNELLKIYVKVGLLNENTIIFAHSIAPIFICKFLIENKIKVKRIVTVCGFNNYIAGNKEFDSVNKSMYTDNLKEVKNYCDDIISYYSDNDPYVPFEKQKDFADEISNKQIIIKNGGHLNAEFNYLKFEELKKYI